MFISTTFYGSYSISIRKCLAKLAAEDKAAATVDC